ncbi:MAG: class I SAM-dependent methyltransferase [Methanocalculus sp.]|uniref:class I SAM-dependent methyltransferase n=1 Tax=Methanocalculus sp. TaxID=2004547 RepID=UPI00271C3AF8|nr:class I SAM-dependent methyltransferase [Methanocalculus sp.]MDO9540060.1 class I SAM-dependent methyltransferase [Methanocalculus sp.]
MSEEEIQNEDAIFTRQLELFVSSSTEKGIELLVIGDVIAGLPDRRRFLDVGAGGGDLTVPISQLFEETVVVEPNPLQARAFRRRHPEFTVVEEGWESVDQEKDLGGNVFDLILCSHVLYYIPTGDWDTLVYRMYTLLSAGGCLAIVLQSPLGEVADFFNRFTSYDVAILELAGDLISQYGDDCIGLQYFQNQIITDSLEEMTEIGLFLLIDPKFREQSREIARYFQEHHQIGESYRLKQDEILLTVWRRE